jgi:hypothetical protein
LKLLRRDPEIAHHTHIPTRTCGADDAFLTLGYRIPRLTLALIEVLPGELPRFKGATVLCDLCGDLLERHLVLPRFVKLMGRLKHTGKVAVKHSYQIGQNKSATRGKCFKRLGVSCAAERDHASGEGFYGSRFVLFTKAVNDGRDESALLWRQSSEVGDEFVLIKLRVLRHDRCSNGYSTLSTDGNTV